MAIHADRARCRGDPPPWLRLIVVDAALAQVRPATANSLAVLTVPGTELPPATDGWAWAHVQVLGQQAGSPTLAQRLSRPHRRLTCRG